MPFICQRRLFGYLVFRLIVLWFRQNSRPGCSHFTTVLLFFWFLIQVRERGKQQRMPKSSFCLSCMRSSQGHVRRYLSAAIFSPIRHKIVLCYTIQENGTKSIQAQKQKKNVCQAVLHIFRKQTDPRDTCCCK